MPERVQYGRDERLIEKCEMRAVGGGQEMDKERGKGRCSNRSRVFLLGFGRKTCIGLVLVNILIGFFI